MTNRYLPPREATVQFAERRTWPERVLVRVELSVALLCAAAAPVSYFLLAGSSNPRVARFATTPVLFFLAAGAFIGGAGLIQQRRGRLRWLGQVLALGGGFLLVGTTRMVLTTLTYARDSQLP